MSGLALYGDGNQGHTLVSNLFLDNYMPAANGEYVKVYLYLLRCLENGGPEISITLIADKFDHTESDIRRALKYWEKMHLLRLQYDDAQKLTGIQILSGAEQNQDEPAQPFAEERPDTGKKKSKMTLLSPGEAQQLLFICEQYLGKTLSSQEISKLLDFHDSLGFDPELIEYLVEYCVSKRHKGIHYIESVALAWHQDGITNVTEARRQTNTYSKAYFSILKAFGIAGRNPVDAEISYMNKWMKDYGFSLEIITEACNRTMAAIHQPSFEYADKILSSWKKHNIASLSDLEALDQERRAAKGKAEPHTQPRKSSPSRFHNFREREYDFEELEKKLINT